MANKKLQKQYINKAYHFDTQLQTYTEFEAKLELIEE